MTETTLAGSGRDAVKPSPREVASRDQFDAPDAVQRLGFDLWQKQRHLRPEPGVGQWAPRSLPTSLSLGRLQRIVGNQVVQQLVKQSARTDRAVADRPGAKAGIARQMVEAEPEPFEREELEGEAAREPVFGAEPGWHDGLSPEMESEVEEFREDFGRDPTLGAGHEPKSPAPVGPTGEREPIDAVESRSVDDAAAPATGLVRIELERPVSTLARGGTPSTGFVTTGSPTSRPILIRGRNVAIRFRPRVFHVLDAIEFDVSRAASERDLGRILMRYLGVISVEAPAPDIFEGPLILPAFPTTLDPARTTRLEVYLEAVERRIRATPGLGLELAPSAMQGRKRERRPGQYPVLWPWILPPPTQVLFVRVSHPARDDELAEKLLAGKWKRAREEDLHGRELAPHHVVPLFLGGADLPSNVILWNAELHRRGHTWLRNQPQMRNPPKPLTPLPADLLQHKPGTEYRMVGVKTSEDQVP